MWFKQIQIFQLKSSSPILYDKLIPQLQSLVFQPCLPTLPHSAGWIAPVNEPEAPIAEEINQRIMLCMQIEERILPSFVIRQNLHEKVQQLQATSQRKLGKREKDALKDEIIMTLLPKSFTKLTKVFGYIDLKHQWLVLGAVNKKKTESFLNLFKKSLGESVQTFEINRIPPVITQWLSRKNYPNDFVVEKKCTLQDANQKTRIIRCQQQDLFVNSILEFIKDGCELKQLALIWQDKVNFVLADDFTLRSIRYEKELTEQSAQDLEAETQRQKFMANFFMMGETLAPLLQSLLTVFIKA
ncbi:MAG: recombination-associated protein RdgC [Proteobacteria bacterium]|nr:recombination-associated protein RdgC [Pseudomonadota bacterium]